MNLFDLKAFKQDNPGCDPSRLRRTSLSDEQIQTCSLSDGVSQPIHIHDAAVLASEAREQRFIAASPHLTSHRRVSLISDYRHPPPKIPADITRCAAGMDFGVEFESMSVDDKSSFLERKIQDAAIETCLENALMWIERHELCIELDESGGPAGQGYVREQTHTLGQLGCPFSVTDLIYHSFVPIAEETGDGCQGQTLRTPGDTAGLRESEKTIPGGKKS